LPETEASEQRGGEQRTGQKGKDDGSQRGCANHGGDRKGRWMVGGPWSVDGHGGGGWARGRGVVGSESSHRGYDTRAWERGNRLRCAGQRLQDLSRTAIGKRAERGAIRGNGGLRGRWRDSGALRLPPRPSNRGDRGQAAAPFSRGGRVGGGWKSRVLGAGMRTPPTRGGSGWCRGGPSASGGAAVADGGREGGGEGHWDTGGHGVRVASGGWRRCGLERNEGARERGRGRVLRGLDGGRERGVAKEGGVQGAAGASTLRSGGLGGRGLHGLRAGRPGDAGTRQWLLPVQPIHADGFLGKSRWVVGI
jgi:hypothetical protein